MRLSARNQLRARVLSVAHGDLLSTVKTVLPDGQVVTAVITKESVVDLDLAPDDEVLVVLNLSDRVVQVRRLIGAILLVITAVHVVRRVRDRAVEQADAQPRFKVLYAHRHRCHRQIQTPRCAGEAAAFDYLGEGHHAVEAVHASCEPQRLSGARRPASIVVTIIPFTRMTVPTGCLVQRRELRRFFLHCRRSELYAL